MVGAAIRDIAAMSPPIERMPLMMLFYAAITAQRNV